MLLGYSEWYKKYLFYAMLKKEFNFENDFNELDAGTFGTKYKGVKYYNGHRSPITVCKEKNGYSEAWLHHKGRNKHHFQYWVDLALPQPAIIMPYKYAAEMVCDQLAAGIVYNGKNWTPNTQLEYYMHREVRNIIHPQVDKFLTAVFTGVSQNGLDATLTKKNIRSLYEKYCIRMENLDENKI